MSDQHLTRNQIACDALIVVGDDVDEMFGLMGEESGNPSDSAELTTCWSTGPAAGTKKLENSGLALAPELRASPRRRGRVSCGAQKRRGPRHRTTR